jgi:uncharacterized protein YaiE (UPF0345 family)
MRNNPSEGLNLPKTCADYPNEFVVSSCIMKHNSYFDGKVQSLAFAEPEGPATLGVIEAGAYSFSTSSEERMTVLSGTLRARLPGEGWKSFRAGEGFVVPKGVAFEVEAPADAAYACRYR